VGSTKPPKRKSAEVKQGFGLKVNYKFVNIKVWSWTGLPNDLVSHAKAINVTTGDKTSEIRESRGVISHVGCEHRCTDEGGSALSAESKGGGVGFWGVKFLAFLMLIEGLTGIRTQQILGYITNISV
jgi:hypothetical protein